MTHPYLININDKDNWLYPTNGYNPDGSLSEEQRTLSMPEGIHKMFCYTDSLMYPTQMEHFDGKVGMHDHHFGFETFFVEGGAMDLYIDGKRCRVEAGNVIHLQPYQAHGMVFHEPTIYRGIFHDWNCIDDAVATSSLEKHIPDAKKDPKFFGLLIANIDMFMREQAVDYPLAPISEVSAVRSPDAPLAKFELDGVTAKMMTARWENNGVKELWRFELEPGFFAQWEDYPAMQEMYYIREGAVRFKVYDEEFLAGPDSIVKIPKYAPHSLVTEEKTVLHDVGGLTQWYSLLSDRDSIAKTDPIRLSDPEATTALKAKYNCNIKSYGRK